MVLQLIFFLFAATALTSPTHLHDQRQVSGRRGGSSKQTPKLDDLPPRPNAPAGAKHVKGTYGPFTIPAYKKVTSMSGMTGEGGMAMPSMRITPPADNATFTYIKADLVFEDGSVANYNNGVWLHHVRTFCFYLPYLINVELARLIRCYLKMMMVNIGGASGSAFGGTGGGMPGMFYSIGNDRSAVSYPGTGVYLPKGTTFLLSNELAQLNDIDVNVYISVDYEWLPGKPAGYKNVLAISQDASNGQSHPPAGQSSFILTSRSMTIQKPGKILSQYGKTNFDRLTKSY
jgi:hypothetical protein